MRVRLAQDKDYTAIAKLHRFTIRHINSKDYPEDVISVWSGRAKACLYKDNAPKVRRWVAIDKDEIVGFCDHDFACELGGLYVHKDYQGKGVGKKLLTTAENSMKKDGCKKIKIVSTITAKTFYEKNGYKVVKKDIHKIKNKTLDVFHMIKKFDNLI